MSEHPELHVRSLVRCPTPHDSLQSAQSVQSESTKQLLSEIIPLLMLLSYKTDNNLPGHTAPLHTSVSNISVEDTSAQRD